MNGMNDDPIEGALKDALRRREAPSGFANRVLARAAHPTPQANPWLRMFPHPLMRWAALAAVATAMLVGMHVHNVRQLEGEAAKQRLMLALRIAGSKLQLAKAKVNEINASQTNDRTDDRQVKE